MLCSRFFGLFPWHPSCGNTPTPGGHSSRSLEAMDQAKPRVLVVDDDPLTRSLLSIALQSQAFEVIPAGDAGAALEQVRSEAPEIVILDLRLPGLDGMEALRKLKEIAPELPVVILTGYGDVPSAVPCEDDDRELRRDHPHRVRRRPVSGRGDAPRRVRLPDQTR